MKLAVYIVCLWALGTQGYSVPEHRILYGAKAQLGMFPWQVAIDGPGICGGSLIHPNYVLTAAHCVLGADTIKLRFGDIEYYGEGEIQRTATKFFPHEEYNGQIKINDIALIYIEEPVPESNNVRIIKLSESEDFVDEKELLTVSGYGLTETGTYGTLLYRHVYSISNEDCAKHWVADDKRVCTTGYVCKGDSGGPLVQHNGKDYIQVGVVSFGWCTPNKPAGFARTSSYRDWIAKITNNEV